MSAFVRVVRVVRVKQHCTSYGECLSVVITIYSTVSFDPDDPDEALAGRCLLRFCSSGWDANVRVDPDSRLSWASADSRSVSNVRVEADSTLTRYVLGEGRFSRPFASLAHLKKDHRIDVGGRLASWSIKKNPIATESCAVAIGSKRAAPPGGFDP